MTQTQIGVEVIEGVVAEVNADPDKAADAMIEEVGPIMKAIQHMNWTSGFAGRLRSSMDRAKFMAGLACGRRIGLREAKEMKENDTTDSNDCA